MLLLVEEGLGYALCLDRLINTTENSNLCFRPLSPPFEAKLNIIWKKHQIFSKAAEKFLLQIQKIFPLSCWIHLSWIHLKKNK